MKEAKYKVPQLGLRMVRERTRMLARDRIECPSDVAAIAQPLIGRMPVEHLIAIVCDGRSCVTSIVTIAQGGGGGVGLVVADVLRAVLVAHGRAFALVHNHPSGDPTPSSEDVRMTRAVAEAARLVGLPMIDHIVVIRDPDAFRSVLERP